MPDPSRADDAQTALDTIVAIRRLHHPREGRRTVENGVKWDPPKVVVFCDHCEFMEYPCATIRLLDAYGAP